MTSVEVKQGTKNLTQQILNNMIIPRYQIVLIFGEFPVYSKIGNNQTPKVD